MSLQYTQTKGTEDGCILNYTIVLLPFGREFLATAILFYDLQLPRRENG